MEKDAALRTDLAVMVEGLVLDLVQLELTVDRLRRQVRSLQLVLETPTVGDIVAKET